MSRNSRGANNRGEGQEGCRDAHLRSLNLSANGSTNVAMEWIWDFSVPSVLALGRGRVVKMLLALIRERRVVPLMMIENERAPRHEK